MVCTASIYAGAVFFHAFLKFKRGLPSLSTMITPVRAYDILRIYSAVILLLAINSLKMKQIDFVLLCSSRAVER